MSYTIPWTLRVYDALPGNPLATGVGFTSVLLIAFFFGRILVDGGGNSSLDDVRVAVTHIVQTGYTATAYAYLLMSARATALELGPLSAPSSEIQAVVGRVGKHPWWILVLVGAGFCLMLYIPSTNVTTPDDINPWAWQNWTYDICWHRVTSVLFYWWTGCLFYVIVVESVRLSRVSDSIASVDLLDLNPYRCLIRQGMTNALLVIGAASLASLLLVESRYGPPLLTAWIICIAFAWIGLLLPLRGIRRKIRQAKEREFDWCRCRLQSARDALKAGEGAQHFIAELIAYRSTIENIRIWPFDNPTLARFALYLLIPLGSWLGGAFVERGLDLFLS